MCCLQKKEDPKKKVYERGSVTIPDEPLDDPVAEKRRQQQYVPETTHSPPAVYFADFEFCEK